MNIKNILSQIEIEEPKLRVKMEELRYSTCDDTRARIVGQLEGLLFIKSFILGNKLNLTVDGSIISAEELRVYQSQ